ncbi:hypothetical protein GE09DRAFT_968044 [Coniochaeta sp. 2T2.1]|nr:hypothetical protein GE09DRAFT_968044 [Coniochaeta sp. 2T2.1]
MSSKRAAFGGKSPGQSPRTGFGGFSTASSTTLSYIAEPPDLSTVSDANVVVSLKNLLKKDSTTKAKGLEDLLVYIKSHPYETDGGVEEPVLEAWVKLYGRTSIDNSRRVRELCHHVQLELMNSARKRMERRIPKVAGPWLAGTFDKDRVVSQAATKGLSMFVNTDEKTTQFWRKLQTQILDYALESVRETPDTLSDERSTNKEDSEAKYYRVVGASLALVLNLLEKVGVEQSQEQLDQFLGTESVWALAAAEDSHVRRMVYQLGLTCLKQYQELLKSHLPKFGKAIVSDALKIKQTGSALDYVRVLTTLTSLHPEVWGTKKQPLSRLRVFVEKGSQGSSSAFWQELRQLIAALPQDPVASEVATEFLRALRTGISSREEPRANAPYGWACYFETFLLFLTRLTPEDAKLDFIKGTFYPITQQYIHPTPETSSWTIAAPLSLLPKAWVTLAATPNDEIWQSVSEEWKNMGEALKVRMNNSLPEISKDHQISQQGVADEGDRFFALAGATSEYITKNLGSERRLREPFTQSAGSILREAVELLVRRDFKPFGAAAIVESALKRYSTVLEDDGNFLAENLFERDPEDLKKLLASSSAPYLLSSLDILGTSSLIASQRYDEIWTSFVGILLNCGEKFVPSRLILLLSTEKAKLLAQNHQALQDYLVSISVDTAKGQSTTWELFDASLTHQAFTDASVQNLAGDIVQAVGSSSKSTPSVLKALELILQRRPSLFSDASDLHVQLVAKLLALTEISDEAVSARVTTLRALLEKHTDGDTPLVGIVQENLDNAEPTSLEIDTLVQQAKSMLSDKTVSGDQLLPNTNIWMEDLLLFLQEVPDASLSLTSNLGGAYYLVHASPADQKRRPRQDRQGCSIPARMATYTTKLLASGLELSSLPQNLQAELLYLICLVVEIAEDQLQSPNLSDGNRLWSRHDGDGEVEEFTTSTRKIVIDIVSSSEDWAEGKIVGGSLVGDLIALMLQQARGLSPLALYSAKALTGVLQSLTEAHGLPSSIEETVKELNILKAKPDTVLSAMAFVKGFGETLISSPAVKYLCNRLISDVAGASATGSNTLLTMVLLNACLSVYESGELPVESRRQIFAVRQITSWTESPSEMDGSLVAEVCKALNLFFPNVSSIYGPYWDQALQFCIYLWSNAGEHSTSSLPCLHASLKLSATLESLRGENDDLDDALAARSEEMSHALIHLLQSRGDDSSPMSDIVDSLLCRRVAKIPLDHVKDLSELYGLVASESREIETAAFGVLSKAIAAAQSQISIDALLEKRDAKLPDELLSLLLDAPSYDAYPDDVLASFPTPIRSYLLSWHLVFDAFRTAASKVRGDYAEQLKATASLEPLLNFMFDVLGHSAARPLNLDKAGFDADHIRTYDLKTADGEPDERNMQWLLIHLFYLSMKYLPGLFKSWFLDCRSKQTKVAVESWMTKYFSPVIIAENLDEVADWAAKQEAPEDDEKELMVKVSRAAREVTAGYEVDELQASIAIRIPPGYPLESVSVVGIQRVAVSEKKWQNWLMITQGVITLGNGSIIDGLTTFRRNVVGALKGQTECAICYSIISTDKKMPDKKCGTCRNAFHRTCLYKWFQTSHQNTCPLCRNPIDYLGSR